VSLIATRRNGGKIVHEHIGSLGSIEVPQSIEGRIEFWRTLHDRLAQLSNRVDDPTRGKIMGAVHARIPMVTIEEQRDVKLRNAEADEGFWGQLHEMQHELADGHQRLAADAERAAVKASAAAKKAAEQLAVAKDRIARLKSGEDVDGGLRTLTWQDFQRILVEHGLTKGDLRHAEAFAALYKLDPNCEAEVLAASAKASNRAEKKTVRELLRNRLAGR
jgi:hypothetical protein